MRKFFGWLLSAGLGYGLVYGLILPVANKGVDALDRKVAEWTSSRYHSTTAPASYPRLPFFSPDFQPGPDSKTWEIIKQGGEKYGVSPNIIKAILYMETGHGRNQGESPALAYFQRRGDRENLDALKTIASRLGVDPQGIRGSSKGCIGIPQFLPRNWIEFGVDGDADGKVDLFRSMPDAVHSIANYLVAHGYHSDWEKSLYYYNWDRDYVNTVKGLAGVK